MPRIERIEGKKRPVYRVIAFVGYKPDRTQIRKSTTFKDFDLAASIKQQEKAAKKFAQEWEDRLKNGDCLDGDKITFAEFAFEWLEDAKKRVVYTSYSAYQQIVNDWLIPYFGHMKIAKIKLAMIEDYYKSLAPRYAQSTIKKHVNVLNGIFKMAKRREVLERNPCAGAEIAKSEKQTEEIQFFTSEQTLAFLKSLDLEFEWEYKGHGRIDDTGKSYTVRDYVGRKHMKTQLKVFYHIALFCGMRRGEILALHWQDVDLEKRVIHITKTVAKSEQGQIMKEPKTKTSIRNVPIPKQLVPLIHDYRQEYETYRLSLGDQWQGQGNLFTQADGRLMDLSTPYQCLKRHIAKYNEWVEQENQRLPEGQEKHLPLPMIPLHGLRHSCATLLNSLDVNIVDISDILGHAQTSTTMNIYAHSFEKRNWEACNKMEQFLEQNQIFD